VKQTFFAILLVIVLLLASCGPSTEEVATMTAAAWTATPLPTATPTLTPTATPIPYDVTVKIIDQDGNPIPDASVVFPESGEDSPVTADDGGQAAWNNLPGETGKLSVSAQGYFPAEQALSLERGPNEVTLALERDPFGLLPSEACAPGEKLMYIEDFQDGQAQGWQNITAALEFNANNGWGLGVLEEGNQVVSFTGLNENGDDLQDYTFENAVWRLKVQAKGNDGFSFLNWKHAQVPGGDTRYPLQWGGEALMALTRLSPDAGHFNVDSSNFRPKPDQWYQLEISSYNGQIQVWVDGKLTLDYQDPQPLSPGTIGLEAHIWNDPEVIFYFDDLVVCELGAPFAPMPTPTLTPAP
jgi:3-keto-disaccharide hydrolase/Carboxypeptidase regulatory-like domain